MGNDAKFGARVRFEFCKRTVRVQFNPGSSSLYRQH